MFGLYTNYDQKSNENIYEYANRIIALWHREGRYLEGVQFIRVFIEGLDDKVVPFLSKRDINLRVLLIDELDYNLWIDIVDPSWSGAIPATLILDPVTGRRKFIEKELENNELELEIQSFIKQG